MPSDGTSGMAHVPAGQQFAAAPNAAFARRSGILLAAVIAVFAVVTYVTGSPWIALAPFAALVFGTTTLGIVFLPRNSFLPYYVAIVLMLVAQSVPFFSLAGRDVNLGLHTIFIALLIFAVWWKSRPTLRVTAEPATWLLLGMTAWFLFTILMALRFGDRGIADSVVTWLRWAQFVPLFYLLISGPGDERAFRNVARILFVFAVVIAVWGILEVTFRSEFSETYFRGATTFTQPWFREHDAASVIDPQLGVYKGSANYNVAGAAEAMCTLLITPLLFGGFFVRQRWLRILLFLLLVTGVGVTYSRGAATALLTGLLAMYFGRASARALAVLGIALVLTAAVLVIAFPDFWLIPFFIEVFTGIGEALPAAFTYLRWNPSMGFTATLFGTALHVVAMWEALRAFVMSPIFGWGFFGFAFYSPTLRTAENFYLQILAETGAIGLALLIVFLRKLWNYSKQVFAPGSFAARYQQGFRGAFVAAMVVNMTGTLFYDQRVWGLLLILAAIQIRMARDRSFAMQREIEVRVVSA